MVEIPAKYPRDILFSRAILCVLVSSTAVSAVAQVYDLSTGFSGSSNPNGAWSYELSGSPIKSTLYIGYGNGWGYYGNGDASILQFDATISTIPSLAPVFHAGDVVLHAPSVPVGGPSAFLDVKWTAPANGVISITGKAWDGGFASGRDAQWWISVGGSTVASKGSIYGVTRTDGAALFASNLSAGANLSGIAVAAGETVTLNVSATTYYGYFVGVEETVNFTAVPEPSATGVAASVALLGLATIEGIRRRRRGAVAA